MVEPVRETTPVAVAMVTTEHATELGHTRRQRAARNGLPPFVPYVRGAPRPAWAERNVADAIAEHGEPRFRIRKGGGWELAD